jgi:hypothetical protein
MIRPLCFANKTPFLAVPERVVYFVVLSRNVVLGFDHLQKFQLSRIVCVTPELPILLPSARRPNLLQRLDVWPMSLDTSHRLRNCTSSREQHKYISTKDVDCWDYRIISTNLVWPTWVSLELKKFSVICHSIQLAVSMASASPTTLLLYK